jgi:hypothetical protein
MHGDRLACCCCYQTVRLQDFRRGGVCGTEQRSAAQNVGFAIARLQHRSSRLKQEWRRLGACVGVHVHVIDPVSAGPTRANCWAKSATISHALSPVGWPHTRPSAGVASAQLLPLAKPLQLAPHAHNSWPNQHPTMAHEQPYGTRPGTYTHKLAADPLTSPACNSRFNTHKLYTVSTQDNILSCLLLLLASEPFASPD